MVLLFFTMIGEFKMINKNCGYKLNNGLIIPNIGLGTWHIKDQKIIDDMIYNAYQAGFRHIDTASKYQNEKLIGNTIKKYNIDRANIFLTSKLWKDDKGHSVYDSINDSHQPFLDKLIFIDGNTKKIVDKDFEIENLFSNSDREKFGISSSVYLEHKYNYSYNTYNRILLEEDTYDEDTIKNFEKIINVINSLKTK